MHRIQTTETSGQHWGKNNANYWIEQLISNDISTTISHYPGPKPVWMHGCSKRKWIDSQTQTQNQKCNMLQNTVFECGGCISVVFSGLFYLPSIFEVHFLQRKKIFYWIPLSILLPVHWTDISKQVGLAQICFRGTISFSFSQSFLSSAVCSWENRKLFVFVSL